MASGRNSNRAANAATNRSRNARGRTAAEEGRRQALGAADTARRASGGATKPGPGGPRVSGRKSTATSASSPKPTPRPSRKKSPEMDLNRLTLAGYSMAQINKMSQAEMRKAHADAVAKGYKKGGMATKKKGKC